MRLFIRARIDSKCRRCDDDSILEVGLDNVSDYHYMECVYCKLHIRLQQEEARKIITRALENGSAGMKVKKKKRKKRELHE